MRKSSLSIALVCVIFAGAADARLAANGLRTNGYTAEVSASFEAPPAGLPSLQQLANQPLAR